MITLLISVALAAYQPSAVVCASAYALEAQRRQEAGELPDPSATPQTLTPAQRQAVAASRGLIAEGLVWTALATRDGIDPKAANKTYRELARSPKETQAAFAACSKIKAVKRLPDMAEPPTPKDGKEECAAAVSEMFAEMRACASLETLRRKTQAVQSKLEQGALTCRSVDAARYAWVQIGAGAASADSQRQRARCAGQ